ncbi:hypothetical protein AB0E69_29730 [Kribbella sp. NPDC026611]|uniref:hypothetical protein n=1 Tax=Kribbella sp. NPDC026611 TaxID=3154911 RepID=UPI0033E8134B
MRKTFAAVTAIGGIAVSGLLTATPAHAELWQAVGPYGNQPTCEMNRSFDSRPVGPDCFWGWQGNPGYFYMHRVD